MVKECYFIIMGLHWNSLAKKILSGWTIDIFGCCFLPDNMVPSKSCCDNRPHTLMPGCDMLIDMQCTSYADAESQFPVVSLTLWHAYHSLLWRGKWPHYLLTESEQHLLMFDQCWWSIEVEKICNILKMHYFQKGSKLCPFIVQGWYQSGINRPLTLPWSMKSFQQLWSHELLTVLIIWERWSLRVEFVAIHCSRMVEIRQDQAINTTPVNGLNWAAMVTWVIDSINQLGKVISK